MNINPIEKAERVIASCRTQRQLVRAVRYTQLALKQAGRNGDEALLREALRLKQHQIAPMLELDTERGIVRHAG